MDDPLRRSVDIRAYAKLNLTLDVTGRRDDGYHFMYMVMQSVGLYDELTVSLSDREGIHISCADCSIEQEHNTAYRAAAAFFAAADMEPVGLDIEIEKNIPMEAGLAGGSADAAAVLVALNLLLETNLPKSELCMIGAQVGADVPFCLTGSTMLVEGIGEIFTPLPPIPECSIVIAKPVDGMKSANSFRLYDELEYPPDERPDNDRMFAAIVSGDLEEIAGCLHNVLEQVAPKEPVSAIKNILIENGALGACMTGSGTATFGIFDNKSRARRACKELEDIYGEAFLVKPTEFGVEIVD